MRYHRGTDRLRYGLEAYFKHLKGKWIDFDEVPAAKHKLDAFVSGGKLSFQLVEEVNGHLSISTEFNMFHYFSFLL